MLLRNEEVIHTEERYDAVTGAVLSEMGVTPPPERTRRRHLQMFEEADPVSATVDGTAIDAPGADCG